MLNYQETLAAIHAHKANGRRPNRKRLTWLLEKLGNPHRHFPSIHIVGTNGKGSTTAFLQHILTASGYRTGTFTSPYITCFNERIAIDGKPISNQDLVYTYSLVAPWLSHLKQTELGTLTEFELVCVLAFVYFDKVCPIDIAIIEAGIGGRFDSTSIIKPLALICTSIGYDHEQTLGKELPEIAWHKVGALKRQTPFIFGTVLPAVRKVFLNEASRLDSPYFELGQDFTISQEKATFDFCYRDRHINQLQIHMLGNHQKENSSLAVMASLLIQPQFPKINEATIRSGLARTNWIGRGELIGKQILLDGAHNPQGIQSLLELLNAEFPNRPRHFLFAGLKRKNLADMLRLLDHEDLSVCSFSFPEAAELEDFPDSLSKITDYKSWLEKAKHSSDLFVVTGSLYFISEVRQYLLQANNNR